MMLEWRMPKARAATRPATLHVRAEPGSATLTTADRRAIAAGERELAAGRFVTLEPLDRELERPRRRPRGQSRRQGSSC
jgi:predicted transcriptional regulator